MRKLRRWIRTEMDVELLAGVHGMSMLFIYGFLLWLTGEGAVLFAVIFQMLVLGYVTAWTQRLLFIRERTYRKGEYRLREFLWCLLPIAFMLAAGKLFHWFTGRSVRIEAAFYIIMAIYFVMLWVFLKCFHEEDTEELNQLLQRRKGGEEK